MKRIGLVFAFFLGALIVAAGAAVCYSLFGFRKSYPMPLPKIQISEETETIARGRYLAYGPARCADCHINETERTRLNRGEEPSLSGGYVLSTYLGDFFASNITPDSATGIGSRSDGQLARMFRNGVNSDGHIALPFMDSYADMAENDLTAILSFLRSQNPVSNKVPPHRVNLLGKITLTYFIQPYVPESPPALIKYPEPSAHYGEYLAKVMGGCRACHTARNMKTGDYVGPPFAGGMVLPSKTRPGINFVSPNLTPDSATGHIIAWDEETFIARFRAGAIIPDSPMPWSCFTRMTGDDLRALFRFFNSLKPVVRDNGQTVQNTATAK